MAKQRVNKNSFFTDPESFEPDKRTERTTEEIASEPIQRNRISHHDMYSNPGRKTHSKKWERKTERLDLLVYPSAKAALKEIATREDTSVNEIINTLILQFIEQNL